MLSYDWYVGKKLVLNIFIIVLMITGSIWLTQSLRFVDMIFNHNVSLKEYFTVVLFLIPDLISIMLPFSMFIATLIVYNQMYTQHELIIWKSCGLNNWRLARPALIVGLLVSFLVFLLNVYIVPSSLKQLRNLEHQIRQNFSMSLIKKGTFNTLKKVTVYIQRHDINQGTLKGIFIYQSEDLQKNKPAVVITAKEGYYNPKTNNGQIMLIDGVKQETDPKTKHLTTLTFDKLNYSILPFLKKEQERIIKPYEMKLLQLLNPPMQLSPSVKAKFISEGHQRILMPLMVFVYLLCGIAFVIVPSFSRRHRWVWTTSACVTALLTQLAIFFLLHTNGKINYAIMAAYGVIFVSVVGLILFLIKDNFKWSK